MRTRDTKASENSAWHTVGVVRMFEPYSVVSQICLCQEHGDLADARPVCILPPQPVASHLHVSTVYLECSPHMLCTLSRGGCWAKLSAADSTAGTKQPSLGTVTPSQSSGRVLGNVLMARFSFENDKQEKKNLLDSSVSMEFCFTIAYTYPVFSKT